MIELTINGRRRTLAAEMTLIAYLEESGIDARIIAVEHNGVALRREQFPDVLLRHGDQVEVVRMIGGGCA